MSTVQTSLFAIPHGREGGESAYYDSLPYESYTYPLSHPRAIHTVATLFGMSPPEVETARVLEIGCAGGGNLLPLAIDCPESQFYGIDVSGVQIAQAEAHRQALGLRNLRFEARDISDFTQEDGTFDYIVCHGVFSWVSESVRKRILEVCANNLSENGLAFISYNTLPGWSVSRSIREMMLYHVRRFEDPSQRVRQARLLIDFLADNAVGQTGPYKTALEQEKRLLGSTNDSYVAHEYLEIENAQFYFHEFAAMARENGLTYVGDSSISTMYSGNFSGEAAAKLQGVNDVITQEQYMDFMRNRRFRQTILAKASNPAKRALPKERIFDFYLSAPISPDPESDRSRDERMAFKVKGRDSGFTTHDSHTTALFSELAKHRAGIKAEDLIEKVRQDLGLEDAAPLRNIILQNGMPLVMQGILSISTGKARYTETLSDTPRAGDLPRYQATLPNTSSVTNALYASCKIDTLGRILLGYMDGETPKEDFPALLMEHFKRGEFTIQRNGTPVENPAEQEKILRVALDRILERFAQNGILVT